MKRIFRILTVAVMLMSATPALAQMNIGHCNTDSVLISMPEYDAVMTQLESVQTQHENMIAEMRAEIQEAAARVEAGSQNGWTPLRIQQAQQSIQENVTKLQEYAQAAQTDINEQERQLLQPVLQKLQDAIDAVGEEKKLDYILDSSAGRGTVIFKNKSRDITNDVKAKLGII